MRAARATRWEKLETPYVVTTRAGGGGTGGSCRAGGRRSHELAESGFGAPVEKNSKKTRWSFRVNPATFIFTTKHTKNTKSPMKTNQAGRKLAGIGPEKAPFIYDARFTICGRIGASDDCGGFEWSGAGDPAVAGRVTDPCAGSWWPTRRVGDRRSGKAQDIRGRGREGGRRGQMTSDIPRKTSRNFLQRGGFGAESGAGT